MPQELERLRVEIEGLRASLKRLVLAADDDRHAIERELHEGVQQHLVALAVNLQRASDLTGPDPAAAKALLDKLGHDVQEALDEAARLAQRIHPPLLQAGGVAASLRAGAATAGVPAVVDASADLRLPREVARSIYACWTEALEHADGGTRATIAVREEGEAVAFEVGFRALSDVEIDLLSDRLEALGGWLELEIERDGSTRMSGSLPLLR